jgi:hypothetical protein
MSAISGVYVALKTMADGTCRITIDLDCPLAQLAELNLMPGTPLAIARLTNEAGTAAIQPQPEPEPAPEPPKGGALARLAGMWCADPEFHAWLGQQYKVTIRSVSDAAAFIRHECGVESRAEFDNDPRAERSFNNLFRLPYMAYQQGRTK